MIEWLTAFHSNDYSISLVLFFHAWTMIEGISREKTTREINDVDLTQGDDDSIPDRVNFLPMDSNDDSVRRSIEVNNLRNDNIARETFYPWK